MADLEPGTVLGERFEIAGVLGRGGMATVYLARDRVRGESVALKVLHPHLVTQGRERLRREVAAAARIHHPHALVVRELFDFGGTLALSMPLHPGSTLSEDVATRGPLPADALWRLGEALAGALAEAHRAGVVHRDVAPGNVLIDPARAGTLTDFGLARLDEAQSRTATTALGTAGYTAPEVLDGQRAGPAADLYGLGCVLYLAATGHAPFEGASPLAVMQRQAEGRYTPLATARPDLPAPLREGIEALLARDPAARPESARAVAEAFARRERAPASRAPEPTTALVSAALPAGTSSVLVQESHEQRHRRRHRRQRERRKQRAGLEGLIEGVGARVEQTVRDALGLPPGQEPEALLREAVAEAAGLPPDALVRSPALDEPRFRLVEGVSEAVAGRLAEQATALGFRATVQRDAASLRSVGERLMLVPRAVFLLGMLGTAAWLASLALTGGGSHLWGLVVLSLFLGVASLLAGARSQGSRPQLPLAYRADLRPYLTPAYALRLPSPAAPAPATPAAPWTALVQRTGERLAALEQAIGASAGRLPSPAVLDLQTTLGELRSRASAIEAALRALAALPGLTAAEEQAAALVSGRLERTRTRARAGEPVDPAELAQLERAVAAHQERLATADQDDQRNTMLQAALLEIGAAAERCRRTLLHEPDPARSVEDLLRQLKTEGAQAAAAVAEVDDARRRAAARQRQPG